MRVSVKPGLPVDSGYQPGSPVITCHYVTLALWSEDQMICLLSDNTDHRVTSDRDTQSQITSTRDADLSVG